MNTTMQSNYVNHQKPNFHIQVNKSKSFLGKMQPVPSYIDNPLKCTKQTKLYVDQVRGP